MTNGALVIYFLRCETTGLTKIGYALNAAKRCRRIALMCPTPLRVVAVALGTREDERRFHEDYAEHRRHGEWFALPDDSHRLFHNPKLDAQIGDPLRDAPRAPPKPTIERFGQRLRRRRLEKAGPLLVLLALAPLSGCYLSHHVQAAEDPEPAAELDGGALAADSCDTIVWEAHGACEYGTGECIELGARCGVAAGCYDLGAGVRRCRPACRLDRPSCQDCRPAGFTLDGVAYGYCA